jgi:hypothetical protein
VVDVVWRGERRAMRARVATRDEVERLWPLVVETYRSYERYRQRASREIPLVICEPEPASR